MTPHGNERFTLKQFNKVPSMFNRFAFAALLTFTCSIAAHAAEAPVKKPAAKPVAKQAASSPKKKDYCDLLADGVMPDKVVIYKTAGDRALEMHMFKPRSWQASDKRACYLTIHGGGWTGGSPSRMYPFAKHYADRGMVAMSLQYRLVQKNSGTTPFDCVRDGKSAVRYLKTHAAELGIDPSKIIVSGSSAGGHVALATAMFAGVEDPHDDLSVSPTPAALIPFWPVIDCSPAGYGNAKCGPDWKQISPAHQVTKGMPPILLFHGTGDRTTPFAGAELFKHAMDEAGNRCDLVVEDGGEHGWFMRTKDEYDEAMARSDAFLRELKLLK